MIANLLPRPALPAGLARALILLAMLAALAPLARYGSSPLAQSGPLAQPAPDLAALPLIIAPTANPSAPFGALSLGGGVSFQPDAIALGQGESRLTLRFVGASPDVGLEPAGRRAGTISSRIGADPAGWRSGVPTYAALDYRGLFPGVDLRYDGTAGQLKGTYTLAAHADPGAIRWRYEGAAGVALDPAGGDLVVRMAGGATLREHAPVAWQDVGGRRVPVASSFTLAGAEAGFTLGAYDPALPLVIDPTLTFATFLGGGSADYGRGIDVDSQGNIYVVGDFFSSDFMGYPTAPAGMKDVMLLKLNPAGNDLLYGVFEGGASDDEGLAVAVSPAGEAFVLIDPGDGYPASGPISSPPATGDGILMKIDARGEHAYSTYVGFGFSNSYTGEAIAFGPDGRLYIAGQSYIAIRRLAQIAVAEINPASGAVLRGFDPGDTYVTTDAAALAIGADKRIYVTGTAGSPFGDFPTTSDALQKVCGRKLILGDGRDCQDNAYLLILTPAMQVAYASYLGGSGSDEGRGIAVDAQGNAIIVGNATSEDFPVKNAIRPSCPSDPSLSLCSYDGFATKIAPAAGIVYSTYIATPGEPESMTFVTDVVADKNGNAYVYGFTNSANMPIKDAVQPSRSTGICLGGFDRFCFDAFVTGLAPDGGLRFGTYLGGALDEYSGGIALDGAGALYLSGYTESTDFPASAGAIQPAKSVGKDFFVARIALSSGSSGSPGAAMPYRVNLPLLAR